MIHKLPITFRFVLLSIFLAGSSALGQISPLKSQFFENNLLVNPAYSGAKEKGAASMIYSSQWSKIDGSPKTMSAIIHSPITGKIGVGLSLINDKAGLINRTSIFGSYSYYVKLTENTAVRFGLAAGVLSNKADIAAANTPNQSTDPALNNYNNRQELMFKGGAGALINTNKFEVQLAWHDLTRRPVREISTVDYPGFTASVTYQLGQEVYTLVEPLIGIRQIKGLTRYYDFGFKASFKNEVDMTALYHTNRSFTGGVGFKYKDNLRFVFLYNSHIPGFAGITGGTYEVSLLVPFQLKK